MSYSLIRDPRYQIGDLVNSKSYPEQTWEIVGYSCEQSFYNGESNTSVHYNLIGVVALDTLFVDEEDLILVCKWAYAKEYIAQLDENGKPPSIASINPYLTPSTTKEVNLMRLSYNERNEMIDDLLDRMNQIKGFTIADGEVSEEYQRQIEEIKVELNKLRELSV